MSQIDRTKTRAQSPILKAYFSERELAEYLAVSVKWLQKMRVAGGGIPFVKFGSAVRYPLEQVHEYERERLRLSTSDAGHGATR
ncbi:MAG: DNA-binding protein [Sphingobacteriales bacterium]|nr:MAG: DNA-binding protein [Sphingobacteriales bacterium]